MSPRDLKPHDPQIEPLPDLKGGLLQEIEVFRKLECMHMTKVNGAQRVQAHMQSGYEFATNYFSRLPVRGFRIHLIFINAVIGRNHEPNSENAAIGALHQ